MPAQNPTSERAPQVADRLAEARRGRFVGREAELELFRSALLADTPPFVVLHVYGPGGVGKTTLLREYAGLATECGRPVIRLDSRNVEASPPGFLRAMRQAQGLDPDSPPAAEWPPNGVWLIDTYETLAGLDAWLRETFLPQLPASSLVVLAGRNPPAPAWHTDIDWAALTRSLALHNLRPEESQTYLAVRGVPPEQHPGVLAFTHGHPLALSLIADRLGSGDSLAAFNLPGESDVVRILLERFVQDVPDAQHREALKVCTLARTLTEAMLADALDDVDAHGLFEWLRRLSFIEHGPYGLFPHDLARTILNADFRWRDSEGYRRLSRRVYLHLRFKIARADNHERQRLQLDALFVIRNNPANAAFFDWNALDGVYAEPAAPTDTETIVEMVRRHQGDASAQLAQYWLARQPEAFLVFRNVEGECFGFMAHLALHHATSDDIAADPAVRAALDFVRRHGPARPGEEIAQLRFWMDRERHQAVTAAINLTAMNVVTHLVMRPRLAWNFIVIADPDFWLPHFSDLNFPRSPGADFEIDGRSFGSFAHDWRLEPIEQWVTGDHPPMTFAEPPAPALPQAEFAQAVRQALRDYTRPDLLAANPLVHSGNVQTAAGLQALLREAASTLTHSPKDVKLHRALWHTYFEPAPTQEQAAELLNLPFSTYRYHLTTGLERLTDWLWRETGDAER